MTAIEERATSDRLRVLIVAENASARFGGESILPLHYFRHLRRRAVEVWMVAHDRTRSELAALLPDELDRIEFAPDTWLDRLACRMNKVLPPRLNHITFLYILRLHDMLQARRVARRLIAEHAIDVVHQPIPVSPKEPSVLYGLGVPVVIGPMNGGMNYPPAFAKQLDHWLTSALFRIGRAGSALANRLLPGKILASVLLVANERTRRALPRGVRGEVVTLVENGVDLSLWAPTGRDDEAGRAGGDGVRFLFMGRLVDWKGVDLLLEAFRPVVAGSRATLEIVGDGPMRGELERLAAESGLAGSVRFSGWVSQGECAEKLRGADALVLPSLYECGGAVVLEAMACGRAVIATDWGGPSDYLDETCGVLVRPDSREGFVAGLTEAMSRLAASPALCKTLGQAGRERAARGFDWEEKVDRILEVYQRAVDRDGAARPARTGGVV